MDKVDLHELIDEIREHELLYNPQHHYYNDITEKSDTWKLIGKKFGITDEMCKKKWKAVRNAYNKKLRKGEGDQFRYADQISFLLKYKKTPATVSVVTKADDDSLINNEDMQYEDEDFLETEVDTDRLEPETNYEQVTMKNEEQLSESTENLFDNSAGELDHNYSEIESAWMKSENYNQQFEIENIEKLEADDVVEEDDLVEEEDDDKIFLLSLLKEMKKIPKYHKIDARLNILVVLKKWQRRCNQIDNGTSTDSLNK